VMAKGMSAAAASGAMAPRFMRKTESFFEIAYCVAPRAAGDKPYLEAEAQSPDRVGRGPWAPGRTPLSLQDGDLGYNRESISDGSAADSAASSTKNSRNALMRAFPASSGRQRK
jgi:hypothetical protein